MKIFSILGGGFGLYGYLPTIIKKYKIILPLKYKKIMQNRNDIKNFIPFVEFSDDLNYIFRNIDSIVIALNPAKQEEIIQTIINFNNIKNIFLEKPLASNATKAINIQALLFTTTKLKIRIAYLFIYCTWFELLNNEIKMDKEISIKWQFKAHHYKNNIDTWKRHTKEGGGALNFFGIHLIALATYLGYEIVEKISFKQTQNLEIYQFKANFIKNNNKFKIILDCKASQDIFTISSNNKILYNHSTPFGIQKTNMDFRICLIEKYLQSNKHSNAKYYDWFNKTAMLWFKIEKTYESFISLK